MKRGSNTSQNTKRESERKMSRRGASTKSSAPAVKGRDDGKGGLVSRLSEAELIMKKPNISPEDVLRLDRATESK